MAFVDLPATFNTGQVLSGYLCNQMRDAAIQLDGLVWRTIPVFDGLGGPDTASVDLHTAGDYRLWWGGIRYRTGMTTLTIEGISASYTGGTTIKVYLNGSGTAALTMNAAATWASNTISISSGYADGDIILIEIRTNGNGTKTSKHLVTDVYAGPITLTDSYPGVPTFGTTYTAANLNQLLSAADWLYRRIDAVPFIPQIAHLYTPGTHRLPDFTLYSGSVARYQTNDILRIGGTAFIIGNTLTGIRITYNGSTAYSAASWSVGQTQTFYVPITLTHTVGTRAEIRIEEDVTTGNLDTRYNTRWHLTVLRTEAGGSGYPVQTPPTAFPEDGSLAQTTLTTRLNALGTMLTGVKAQIDGVPNLWNRARGFRRRYAQDEHQNTKHNKRYVARKPRQGEKLIVKGKGVSIGWGGLTVPAKDEVLDYDDYTFANTKQIIDGEKIETKVFYFDECEGLYPGVAYSLFGDVMYAEERLLV